MKKIILAILFLVLFVGVAHAEIVVILDKSGSMDSIKTDVIGSFNGFLAGQKAHGEWQNFTLILFNDSHESKTANIKEFEPLDCETYNPSGMTALYDAIGETIKSLEDRLEPSTKAIIAIITDGKENSSTEFDAAEIKKLIKHYEKWHFWKFIYLAANQDEFEEGAKIGIVPNNIYSIDVSTSLGVSNTFHTLTNAIKEKPTDSNEPVDHSAKTSPPK